MVWKLKVDFNKDTHGIFLDSFNDFDHYIIPEKQTNRTESYCVKEIKNNYISKGYYCEVGVWTPSVRYAIDLYNPITKHGVEIQNKVNKIKVLIKRLNKYKELFGDNISCILIGNHPLVEQRLTQEGFNCQCVTKMRKGDLFSSHGKQ